MEVVSFMPWLLYLLYPLDRRCIGSTTGLDFAKKRKISAPAGK
jgi:hypothetical protein